MITNATTQGEPFTLEKLTALMKTLPKPQELWSWKMAPSNGGWQFEDDESKVTVCHPVAWLKVTRQMEPVASPLWSPFGIQIIEIDGDNDLAKKCRKRFNDNIRKWIENIEASAPLPPPPGQ